MKDTITKFQFVEEMAKDKYGFSYDGASALFDYFEQYENDCTTEIEFDPIAFRCEFSEYENFNDDGVKSIWMKGENLYIGTSIKFPASLEIYANYINSSFDLETNLCTISLPAVSFRNSKKTGICSIMCPSVSITG